jgi:acetyl esterase/lipase
MLPGRWTWRPPVPPEPRLEQNVTFWTLPGTNRALLCDIWQPPADIPPSGLAFLYFHGSGWHFLDKDMGTRPLFRHLAAQGHVIMDVAYRLCPEADWRGMLGDVKRAIAWMKANATRYGVSPQRIVVAGGSAGAHLALLAAYTAQDAELRPADVGDADLTVAGVVSWYGPTDVRLYHEGSNHIFGSVFPQAERKAGERFSEWLFQRLGINTSTPPHWQPYLSVGENMMHAVFGGTLAERPAEYRLASPVAHAGRHCPPTLLFQGEHDCIVPAEGARQLAAALRATGVPVVHVEYPQTEHAFDLLLPRLSPPAQAALYETERFLALLPATKETHGRTNGAGRQAQANGQEAFTMPFPIAEPN